MLRICGIDATLCAVLPTHASHTVSALMPIDMFVGRTSHVFHTSFVLQVTGRPAEREPGVNTVVALP